MFMPLDDYDRKAIIDDATLHKKAIEDIDMAKARLLAVGWRDKLESATISRRNQALVAQEILYYGTLVLTASQAAIANQGAGEVSRDLIHARNLGGSAAVGSTLFTGHYKPVEQQPIFERAAVRMRCVVDAIADINPDTLQYISKAELDAPIGEDQESVQQLYDEAPQKIVQFIERKSVPELRAALSAITLGLPTKDELAQTFKQYRDQNANVQTKAAAAFQVRAQLHGLTDPHAEDARRFVKAVGLLSVNLNLCAQSNPQ
jgi:hypothetical protein